MIKVKHVNKSFGKGDRKIRVLEDINFQFNDKGLYVIHGRSGSGKTTFLNVISGLDKANKGTIEFDGIKIDKYNPKVWDEIRSSKIGFIFQNYYLLPSLNVYDNVAYVLKLLGISSEKEIDDRVIYVLKLLGLYQYRYKKSHALSGGQMQRVAIARALVKNPYVIIADEPTGNLDSQNTLEVMNIIKEISKTKLVILVTHEDNIAKFYGDYIIEYNDGEIKNFTENVEDKQAIMDTQNIYLGDMTKTEISTEENLKINYYSDTEDNQSLDFNIIFKNNTLYLDFKDSKINKNLIDSTSKIKVFDKSSKRTVLETTSTDFDYKLLETSSVPKGKVRLNNLKLLFLRVLAKLSTYRFKGKLMLMVFIFSGFLVAIGTSQLATNVIPDPYKALYNHKSSIELSFSYENYQSDKYLEEATILNEYLQEHKDEARTNLFISYLNFSFNNFSLGEKGYNDNINMQGVAIPSSFVPSQEIYYGNAPSKFNEIMISKAYADYLIKFGAPYGIWDYKSLCYNSIYTNIGSFKIRFNISGIVDDKVPPSVISFSPPSNYIYLLEETYNGLSFLNGTLSVMNPYFNSTEYFQAFPTSIFNYVDSSNFDFSKLKKNEAYIGSEFAKTLNIKSSDFPLQIKNFYLNGLNVGDIYLVGTYPTVNKSEYELDRTVIINNDLFNETITKIDFSFQIYTIYCKDYKKTINDLNKLNLKVFTPVSNFEKAKVDAKEIVKDQLPLNLLVVGLLFIISALSFYFLIRSSMISRIYEIMIYRCLGTKKTSVFLEYFIEILVITTISTVVGYVATNLIFFFNEGSLFGALNGFGSTVLTTIIGFISIYLFNLLGGLLPVYFLLRKTPSAIASMYDM